MNYKKQLMEEEARKLNENSNLINDFISKCKKQGITLTLDNFHYSPTIGITACYPNILNLLNYNFKHDKEKLISFDTILTNSKQKEIVDGYFYTDNYMIMAHRYFRRGYSKNNSFSPRFIEKFWKYENSNCTKYIALDFDRVKIDIETLICMELDTWYGANFDKDISAIKDGNTKLRPPLDLSLSDIGFCFGNTFSLDIKWDSKNNIKTFQAKEFKEANIRIQMSGQEYFPVKYIHAEFNTTRNKFRHFDGAIHFYTEKEYYQRRDSDFNYNNKNNNQIKSISQKLFKINGEIEIFNWIDLTSQYFTGNPLVHEYFEGNFPDNVIKYIEKCRKIQSPK